jgi:ABC-type proline/glycine betaine transport system substrate-binding protein
MSKRYARFVDDEGTIKMFTKEEELADLLQDPDFSKDIDETVNSGDLQRVAWMLWQFGGMSYRQISRWFADRNITVSKSEVQRMEKIENSLEIERLRQRWIEENPGKPKPWSEEPKN